MKAKHCENTQCRTNVPLVAKRNDKAFWQLTSRNKCSSNNDKGLTRYWYNLIKITDKGPICSARGSELAIRTIGSTLTLKDHFVPYFYRKKHVPILSKGTQFRNNSSHIIHLRSNLLRSGFGTSSIPSGGSAAGGAVELCSPEAPQP